MPIARYGVLVGRAVERRLGTGASPHYQIHMVDDDTDFRIAVNVRSSLSPSEVEFVVDDHLQHPILTDLAAMPAGFKELPSKPGGVSLDYIRGNLFDRTKMVPLPIDASGADNDLNDKLDHYVQRAMGDESAVLYAFGQRWGPETVKDKIFGFKPGNGVHDIHMNQGNSAQFKKDDGVWQDGGLIFHFPLQNQWVGTFLKFQSQAWHTDDVTGHATTTPQPQPQPQPQPLPTGDEPHGLIRIVAALANTIESPEVETVTLLNASPQTVSLAGWSLADKNKNKFALSGSIGAGAALKVTVAAPMQLSNKGGIITVLNEQGLKVDGVSYTQQQASEPGWTIVF
jgi:uncharacterized protein YukJ